jgi:hypothetical protein
MESRYGKLKNIDNKNPEMPEEDLRFILWKAELNKELLSFWESMMEEDE